MIIWKGYGFLVLVIAVTLGAIVSLAFGAVGLSEDVGAGVGALISGVVIWVAGNKMNSPEKNRVFIDKQTGEEIVVTPGHSLFFIKMQYWAFIVGGIGIFMLLDALIHGKSSF